MEFAADTDPQDPASVLHLEPAGNSAAGQELRFPSVTGRRYRIEYSPDLRAWQQLGTDILGTGSEIQITDAEAIPDSRRYYRMAPLP